MIVNLFVYMLIFTKILIVIGYATTEENIYRKLPPIYRIDNYEKCKMEKKLFCKVSVKLKPLGQNISQEWKLIQHSIKDREAYSHDELFHAICLNDHCPEFSGISEAKLNKTVISEWYQRNVFDLGLSADIVYLNCTNLDNIYKPGIVDYIWILFIVSYFTYIFIATFWEYQNGRFSVISHQFAQKYLRPFSVISNFQKLTRTKQNEEYQKLKFIQGIRFYTMLLIIFCHTFSSYIVGYVMNTEYFEQIPNNPIRHSVRNLMSFLVQTFFLLSSFLMSYHFFQTMENNKNATNKLKIAWLTFLNRYLRLVPPVIMILGMSYTIWIIRLFYGPIKDLYADPEHFKCRKNWWISLLLINNHYNQDDMCYFITWYLAADTQLYVLSLLIMVVIWKNKQNPKYLLSCFVALGVLIPAVVCYIYDLDIMYRLTPKNSKLKQFMSFGVNAIYSSTYANLATYMVGISFGCLYFKLRYVEISVTKMKKIIWYTIFLGLPVLVLIISSNYYSRLISAILAGILKPLYAIGIAVGVFGMSRGAGGWIKQICEWKPALILGNLTYSTYTAHYVIVFCRTATATQPFYVSDYVIIKAFIVDAILAFFMGLMMFLFVEMPATNLQNICIPQVRTIRMKTEVGKKK